MRRRGGLLAAAALSVAAAPAAPPPAVVVWSEDRSFDRFDCGRQGIGELRIRGDVTLHSPQERSGAAAAPWINLFCERLSFAPGARLSSASNLDIRISGLVSGAVTLLGRRGPLGPAGTDGNALILLVGGFAPGGTVQMTSRGAREGVGGSLTLGLLEGGAPPAAPPAFDNRGGGGPGPLSHVGYGSWGTIPATRFRQVTAPP